MYYSLYIKHCQYGKSGLKWYYSGKTERRKKAVGIKNVTVNEPFFQGHFPEYPIMPGVLVVEALAQTTCIAVFLMEENKGKLPLFTGIDKVKIRRQVVPGDTLRLEVEILTFKMGMGKIKVKASVEGEVAVEGEIRCAMVSQSKN